MDVGMRSATVDIETWDLNTRFAPIICVSIHDHQTDEMYTFRNDEYMKDDAYECSDMSDDAEMMRDVNIFLQQYHCLWGWNSKKFDIPKIRSRHIMKGGNADDMLSKHMHVDGMWYYKGWHGLDFGSARLGRVVEVLREAGYDISQEKPEVSPEVWLRARTGDRRAIDIVVDRCEADTYITGEVITIAFDLGLISTIKPYASGK